MLATCIELFPYSCLFSRLLITASVEGLFIRCVLSTSFADKEKNTKTSISLGHFLFLGKNLFTQG